ncbi:hypothetical protein BGZ63DRAFT_198476 [Mariannaea sp. PMI_226]|nr:hypothetical protein BGZ63DRAFT_198476 [Mariannaea sp. PMI_226]
MGGYMIWVLVSRVSGRRKRRSRRTSRFVDRRRGHGDMEPGRFNFRVVEGLASAHTKCPDHQRHRNNCGLEENWIECHSRISIGRRRREKWACLVPLLQTGPDPLSRFETLPIEYIITYSTYCRYYSLEYVTWFDTGRCPGGQGSSSVKFQPLATGPDRSLGFSISKQLEAMSRTRALPVW